MTNNKTKILQVNVCLNALSTGRIAEQIGEEIKNNGWESYVLTCSPVLKSKSNVIRATWWIERFLHRVANRFLDMQGYFSFFQTLYLMRKIKKINPDIIHLHNIHDCWLNHPLFFRYVIKKGKPVVWTFHDCWAFTGHCSYFDDANCMKWESSCSKCPLKNSFALDLSKYNYKYRKKTFTQIQSMTIVPVSYWLEDITKKSFLRNYNTQTIHNGIDITKFKPIHSNLRETLGLKNKFVILGVASSWGKSKGLHDFVELSKNVNWQVILIGISSELKNTLPSSIMCVEKTDSQEELAEYYSMADVFVNPTYHDNFPTVNLEALACGTPMVGYRTGGSPEAIESPLNSTDNLCGIIVEKGDINALMDAINKICSEKEEKRLQRRLECRKWAETHFDKNNCYKQYISLYNKILNNIS